MEENRKDIQDMIRQVKECEQEIGRAIVGQRDIIRQVMLALLTGGNVLLEGVPGLGKTQLVKAFSRVLSLPFSRIQFTPDLMPADVTGTNLIVKEGDQNVFRFEKGPVFANLVLADEINRATPKTQAALLEAMQERTVTAGRTTYTLSEPFIVLATQNPIENEGTYPLPEAQLDRFMLKLNVEFPTIEELQKIMDITVSGKEIQLEQVLNGEEILAMRSIIQQLPMAGPVQEYALKIVVGTHPEEELAPDITRKYVAVGASPRAAQAIFMASRARAFMEGRLNVSFEDVKYTAYPALRHRIIPNFEAVSDNVDNDTIVRKIIESVPI